MANEKMPKNATHVLELLNESKNMWYILWAYTSERAANRELRDFGGAIASRPLRVREL